MAQNEFETYSSVSEAKEPSVENVGIGLLDARVSQKSRRMLAIVDKLHALGLKAEIDLPQIVVIGQQSAGKSSLVEAVTGIRHPRASGTCTRCPTECILKRSSKPWVCEVLLRIVTDEGGPLEEPKEIKFGEPITDRNEVEERIRRAQRAILNPSRNPKDFLSRFDDDSEESDLSFSENYVSIQISGPELLDLSFCDLPGIIGSVGKGGKPDDINLVANLSARYIRNPSSVILLTVSCESDIDTQSASSIAELHDPDGLRTIGVLTKPDRIQLGDEQAWIRRIRNEDDKRTLKLGWFCVKQPGTSQLKQGITHDEARKQEELFFSQEPWRSLSGQNIGTKKLVQRLSETQADLISKSFPRIQDGLQEQLQRTEHDLASLPAPPSDDPFSEMMQLISRFSSAVEKLVEGTPKKGGLIQQIRHQQNDFRHAIRLLAPNFKPYGRGSNADSMPQMDFLSNEEATVFDEGVTIYIDEVKDRAEDSVTRELHGHIPFIVIEQFIEDIMKNWRVPVMKYFDAVEALLSDAIKRLVSDHFKRFEHGNLSSKIQSIVLGQIQEHQETARAHLNWLLQLERHPFTLNRHYMDDYEQKFLAHYKGWREKERPQSSDILDNIEYYVQNSDEGTYNPLNAVMSGLNDLGIRGTTAQDLPNLLPKDDEFGPALEIMATVRAYFQVSYKRFVDNVPLAVDFDFVRGLGRDIHKALYKSLIQGTDDSRERCREYLQETPSIALRRASLQGKLARLRKGRIELLHV